MQLLAIGPGAGDRKQECAATGFLISDDGHILTNAHVVEDARRCLASSPDAKILAKFGAANGRNVEAVALDVVAVDEVRDLALLKLDSALPEVRRGTFLWLSRDYVPDGARVWITGHPSFNWQSKTYQGKVIARESLALGEESGRKTNVLILSIPLQRGASGSPVYLESGEVVGIVERQRASNRLETVAVSAAEAVEFLELQGLGQVSRQPPKQIMPPHDLY